MQPWIHELSLWPETHSLVKARNRGKEGHSKASCPTMGCAAGLTLVQGPAGLQLEGRGLHQIAGGSNRPRLGSHFHSLHPARSRTHGKSLSFTCDHQQCTGPEGYQDPLTKAQLLISLGGQVVFCYDQHHFRVPPTMCVL